MDKKKPRYTVQHCNNHQYVLLDMEKNKIVCEPADSSSCLSFKRLSDAVDKCEALNAVALSAN